MRIIVQAMEERGPYIEYVKKHLPGAVFCYDEKQDAMDTFLRAMEMAGEGPSVHMEEDVILTKKFYPKLMAVINERRRVLNRQFKTESMIQFFSMRQADLTIKSRWDSNFAMNQCVYHPRGYSRMLLEYSKEWIPANPEHPWGYDTMMNDWLKGRKERHWIHVPSLVDHRVGKSMIGVSSGHGRSSKRQSLTFHDPEE